MTRFEALVALNMCADIGSFRLKRLLDFFGQPQDILIAPEEKLTRVAGIGFNIARQIRSFKGVDLERELNSAKKQKIKIVTYEDSGYPQNLKHIPDPPIVLYIKGEVDPIDTLSLAIVGSRQASFYGLSSAEKFAADLSRSGFTIISGMARGIDTHAHRGALKAGGRTIACLGSGLGRVYPPENRTLAEQISGNGAVISEFPLAREPLKQNFPRRNRVISGLSLGVLVVEAARNSGALITADFALEQGKEVFALPGKVDSPNSSGTNSLIQQGAKLVISKEDILEEFLGLDVPEKQMCRADAASSRILSAEEDKVYALLSGESLQLDELVEKTKLEIPRISDILLRLQLKRVIRQLPGKNFARS